MEIRSAHDVFDKQATMTDKAVKEQLRQFIEGFATYTGYGV